MKEIPIWEKSNLSLEEAAAYSGIGINKLREITNEDRCKFVLWVGNKRLIKRRLFDQFIEQAASVFWTRQAIMCSTPFPRQIGESPKRWKHGGRRGLTCATPSLPKKA